MSLKADLPGARQAIVEAGGTPSRPLYVFLQNVATTLDAVKEAQSSDVTIPDFPFSENANVVGKYSIYTRGILKTGIVSVLLLGDVETPGNTQYYGSGPTGEKGWFDISDALAGSGNVTLTTGTDGVTAFDLSDTSVTAGTYGSASAIPIVTVDDKGRVTDVTEASITISPQVFNRIDASGDIRVAADGSLRVTY